MSKHTPRSWTSMPATAGFREPDEGDFQIVAVNGICVGIVWDNREEGEANARLIAAAPDLLAACEATLRYISSHQVYDKDAESLLREAVEKATGPTKTEPADTDSDSAKGALTDE